jgi:hypothetical protein
VLLIGLAVGLLLGLSYAWIIDPVRPLNAYPALLRSDYRQEWMLVAAQAYLGDGDLNLLQSRLSGLDDADLQQGLAAAIAAVTMGPDSQAGKRARTLADMFDFPLPPSLAPTPTPTGGGREDAKEGSLSSAYRVVNRSFACRAWPTAHFEVVVRDSNGDGLPGTRLWLVWDEGADWAITGLIPDRGPGFADFEAQLGLRYALGIGEYGMPLLSGLAIQECGESPEGETRTGTWRIVVEQSSKGDGAD